MNNLRQWRWLGAGLALLAGFLLDLNDPDARWDTIGYGIGILTIADRSSRSLLLPFAGMCCACELVVISTAIDQPSILQTVLPRLLFVAVLGGVATFLAYRERLPARGAPQNASPSTSSANDHATSTPDQTSQLTRELEQLIEERTAELAIARDRLELALTGANIGLWDWNAKTDEVYYSATYKSQLGYPEETHWNQFEDWKEQLHPDDRQAALDRIEAYFAHRTQEYKSTFRLRCQDGSYRSIFSQGSGTFDESDQPTRLIGVHVDITDQVRGEQALRQSNIELQQFAYVASHDLQTPLRAIAGFARCLQKDYSEQLDETALDYIRRIVRGAHRMKDLIDDLLAYSRVESRGESFKETNLNEVVDDVQTLLGVSIEENQAVIEVGELPTLFCDRVQITQVLQNLIGNSVKYRGQDTPRVKIMATPREGDWVISVSDNGIGIEPEHLERVFEIFQRLHSEAQYPGTGIGLALCRRIILRHGGHMWVDSQPGQGSTFSFSLPRSRHSIASVHDAHANPPEPKLQKKSSENPASRLSLD